MRSVLVVTSNHDKFQEIAAALRDFRITARMGKADFEEHGADLEMIAKDKAKQAYAHFRKPLLVDDTGIYFHACRNFPGHRAKRVYEEMGLEGVFGELKGKNRNAHFKTVLCFTDGKRTKSFSGTLHGTITEKIYPLARQQFPYERVFLIDGKPLALLPIKEKIRISHRAQAARKFAAWWTNR